MVKAGLFEFANGSTAQETETIDQLGRVDAVLNSACWLGKASKLGRHPIAHAYIRIKKLQCSSIWI